ncbi:class I SAM-dependent methyltransferase [bacterium]|nr:class I SAM-dependent methyltransferase [bacterium]
MESLPVTKRDSSSSPLIRNISDTARWAAWCRAVESERPDAHFNDHLAKRLAGDRGAAIEEAMSKGRGSTVASLVVRTVSFDKMILDRISEGGIDTVVNLAAGLDTRPHRLTLPRDLRWIEVDLPNLVSYKDACLANEPGACRIERVALDLSEAESRQKLLASIGEASNGVLVLTEGLLLYLDPAMVTELATDLAGVPGYQTWLMDLLHPAMLPFVVRSWNTQEAGSSNVPRFAPEGGAEFFQPYGWTLHHWVSALEEAERLNRPISPAGVTLTDAQREASRTMNTYVRLDRART